MVTKPFKEKVIIEKVAIKEVAPEITEKEIEELKEEIEKLKKEPVIVKEVEKVTEVTKITKVEPVKEITKETVITKIDEEELAQLKTQIAEFTLWGADIENLREITKKLQATPTYTPAPSAPIYIGYQGIQVGGTGTFASLGVSGSAGITNLGVGSSTSLGSTSSDTLTVNATSAFKAPVVAEGGLTVGTGTLRIDTLGNLTTTGNITTTGTGDLTVAGDLSVAGTQTFTGVATFTTGTFTGNLTTAGNLIFDLANDVTIQATAPTAARIYTIPDFGSDDTFVGLAATQVLTNKTLTSPIIASLYQVSGGGLLTIPASTGADTFALLAATQTLTNKSLSDSSTYFIDEVDNTKKLQFQLSGLTTATTRTLTIQDANGTLELTGHTHAAGDITSGTLVHERGGLEADVNAYNGLLKISGGLTSSITDSSANWNTAYGWGNHAVQNYFDKDIDALTNISDVTITTPVANQLLKYNSTSSKWENWSPDYITGVAWGDITGTLANQTDLNSALAGKEPTITAGTSSQYWRGDKTWQALTTAAVS